MLFRSTPRTVACQAPLSVELSRQEYWSGLPCLSPGELPDPGIEPRSLALQVDSLLSEPPGKPDAGPFLSFRFQVKMFSPGKLSVTPAPTLSLCDGVVQLSGCV